MKELGINDAESPRFMPKFINPLYLAAINDQEKLRGEILSRIKEGNFSELYPLASNIILTEKELEEIFISWWMYAKEDLMNYYGLALSQNNLEKIKQLDENRKFLKKEEGISR